VFICILLCFFSFLLQLQRVQQIYGTAGAEEISGYTHGSHIQSICRELFQTCHDYALGVRSSEFPMVQPPIIEEENVPQEMNFGYESIQQDNVEEPAHQMPEPTGWDQWDAPRASCYYEYGASSSQFGGYGHGTSTSQFSNEDFSTQYSQAPSATDPGQLTQELQHQAAEQNQEQSDRSRRSPNFFQRISVGLLSRRSKRIRHPPRSVYDT
jgi:hypothetical protein